MRLAVAVCALLSAVAVGDVAAIVRCESADGKVTYSNTDCPPNTKPVRQVDLAPPVVVHDGARPKSAAKGEPAPKLEPARTRREDDPVQLDRELTEQLAAQRRDCEARAREVQRLQDDLAAAAAATRASAELALRRAQDDYRALCPRQR